MFFFTEKKLSRKKFGREKGGFMSAWGHGRCCESIWEDWQVMENEAEDLFSDSSDISESNSSLDIVRERGHSNTSRSEGDGKQSP